MTDAVIETWLRCERCNELRRYPDHWREGWTDMCDVCVDRATELLGHPPFVKYEHKEIPKDFFVEGKLDE
jgi:hypothetical protein